MPRLTESSDTSAARFLNRYRRRHDGAVPFEVANRERTAIARAARPPTPRVVEPPPPPVPEPPPPPLLRECVLAALSDRTEKGVGDIWADVLSTYGTCAIRSVHSHLERLIVAGLVVRVGERKHGKYLRARST